MFPTKIVFCLVLQMLKYPMCYSYPNWFTKISTIDKFTTKKKEKCYPSKAKIGNVPAQYMLINTLPYGHNQDFKFYGIGLS